ncbi:SDR family NAD(P)-dependent oxidoreductase [Ethanoligenens harbinense]|nr:hypothetical protein CXQ68_03060 [Ethanoligenens harbinense YUAN-3]AYF37974.1 hypothetical protein CXP51_02925 [Ethanoligenens harbinense]AYF40720.1 hypothetical protein CN246_03060 [Ethanoligenens harbinense]QCN91553.1 SDR family NAD(P)-dependent oxidoreductase [Ethanoligenens harbinense]
MSENWLELSGKTVVVTGGASGIGKAIAAELVRCGANTVVTDLAVQDGADQDGAYCVQSDVTKKDSVVWFCRRWCFHAMQSGLSFAGAFLSGILQTRLCRFRHGVQPHQYRPFPACQPR